MTVSNQTNASGVASAQTRLQSNATSSVRRAWWFRLIRALIITLAVYYVAVIAVYRFVNPPSSNWMLLDAIAGTSIRQTWIPIDEVSPHVIRAVVA